MAPDFVPGHEFAGGFMRRFKELGGKVVQLRWLAQQCGVEKIVLKKNVLITYFVSNPESPFYRSPKFKEVIGNIQSNPGIFRMREDQDKLSLRSDRVNSIEEAYEILEKLSY